MPPVSNLKSFPKRKFDDNFHFEFYDGLLIATPAHSQNSVTRLIFDLKLQDTHRIGWAQRNTLGIVENGSMTI